MPPVDRRTRELPVRWLGECSLVRLHSSRDSTQVFQRNGSHLHRTDRGGRASRRPFERRVQRGKLQDGESSQLLLSIREGAILYTPLSVLQSHRGPGLRGLQRTASDEDVGLDERLVVGPPRTEVGIIFVGIPCRKSLWWFEDQ